MSASASFANVPGLTRTINATASDVLYITSDGGISSNANQLNGLSVVQIVLYDNGVPVNAGGFRQMTCTYIGAPNVCYWSFAVSMPASGLSHKLEVKAEDNGGGFPFSGSYTLEELELLRMGPVSIKRRVRMLGGDLLLESRPGQGASLEIRVPLN